MAQAKKKNEKIDPFKIKKNKDPQASVMDTLSPDKDVQEAIDQYRECQEQAKHYEGEATVYKDKILNYSIQEYCKRSFHGKEKSFKILGHESIVSYVVQDSSAGLTDDDVQDFIQRWGNAAAEDLIIRDYSSLRFDAKILEAHYDEVLGALQTLPVHILENLFKPMLMKASDHAVEKSRKYVKNPKDLVEMIRQLRIKNYIK